MLGRVLILHALSLSGALGGSPKRVRKVRRQVRHVDEAVVDDIESVVASGVELANVTQAGGWGQHRFKQFSPAAIASYFDHDDADTNACGEQGAYHGELSALHIH